MVTNSHGRDLRSWVESANDAATDFPIQNLPLGMFRPRASGNPWRVGAAIGEMVFDLAEAGLHGLFGDDLARACTAPALNALMSLGDAAAESVRDGLSRALRADTDEGRRARSHRETLLHAQSDVELGVPCAIGDYTDFYASLHHAMNVGTMLRPESPLFPNYKWVPIGYHGRASSIVVSGTPIHRPSGQRAPAAAGGPPTFAPSTAMDYEVEVGFYVGEGNALGSPIPMTSAERHIFGACLVNDWSARDIQAWEYQPLGPFLGKNFATSVSPWVVTRQALAPFRVRAAPRADGDPAPLDHLTSTANTAAGALALTVEVYLETAEMRRGGTAPARLSRAQLADLYWTPAQLFAHHASNGCNLQTGDLLASGTVSGADPRSRGCLLELTRRGAEPITLATGEIRRFLEDGDEVILKGWCEREGFARIGFGECRGRILGKT